jgi:putative methyltransferase (TIGR04325 family)
LLFGGKALAVLSRFMRRSQITEYTNPRLIEHIVERTVVASRIINEDRKINLDAFRIFLAFALPLDKPSSVVDLGGAGGYHYFNAKVAFGESSLNWVIVETSELCRYAKQKNELKEIYFTSNLEDAFNHLGNNVDLLYCSRALQYLPNPLETLREACALLPRHIFLTGLAFSPNDKLEKIKQYSSLSSNGPQVRAAGSRQENVIYELQLLSKSSLNKILSENYVTIFETAEEPRVHRMGSLDIPYAGIYAVRKDIFGHQTGLK